MYQAIRNEHKEYVVLQLILKNSLAISTMIKEEFCKKAKLSLFIHQVYVKEADEAE